MPTFLRDEIGRLILLTKTHQANAGDLDGQLLLDADLAILGAGPTLTALCHGDPPRVRLGSKCRLSRAAGAQFLRNMLRRETIYHTARLHTALEVAARENLQQELNLLTAT